jgi:hypothetical protein
MVRDRGAEVAIVVEGDERTDHLRVGVAIGHRPMIPAWAMPRPWVRDPGRAAPIGPRSCARWLLTAASAGSVLAP